MTVECPQCHQPAMSAWAKLGAGPFSTRHCQACGTPVAVSRLSFLAGLPFLALAIVALSTLPFTLAVILVTLALASDTLIELLFVPLRTK